MISTMVLGEISLVMLYSDCYESLPWWGKAIYFAALIACHYTAYGSEKNLRKKVKCLEEVEIKKGGVE